MFQKVVKLLKKYATKVVYSFIIHVIVETGLRTYVELEGPEKLRSEKMLQIKTSREDAEPLV